MVLRRSRVVLAAAAVAVLLLPGGAAGAAPPPPTSSALAAAVSPTAAFGSIMFGRSGWAPARGSPCRPLPDSVDLGEAVGWMHAETGYGGVLGVIVNKTRDSGVTCDGTFMTYPGWPQLADLRDRYGSVVVSQSRTYGQWPNADTVAAVEAETCGTLATFVARGHLRAWGMFNNPNDLLDDTDDAVHEPLIVARCFAFSRRYGPAVTTKAAALTPPHQVTTISVTSGRCNNLQLACATVALVDGKANRYMLPEVAIGYFSPRPERYANMQFYRFVRGARTTGTGDRWSCTGDVRNHWVTRPEVYCYNDFQTIVRAVAAKDLVLTDPATVAETWGRAPG